VEAVSNTSTVALRVVGDEKGHLVPGGYKYGDLAFQVGGFSNLRQYNTVMSLAGLGHEND
jgi:hypothetical protein